jgi:hypothetical protein
MPSSAYSSRWTGSSDIDFRLLEWLRRARVAQSHSSRRDGNRYRELLRDGLPSRRTIVIGVLPVEDRFRLLSVEAGRTVPDREVVPAKLVERQVVRSPANKGSFASNAGRIDREFHKSSLHMADMGGPEVIGKSWGGGALAAGGAAHLAATALFCAGVASARQLH